MKRKENLVMVDVGLQIQKWVYIGNEIGGVEGLYDT